MFGAIYGDVIGSSYEVRCTKNYNFEFRDYSIFTDDTVLTVAVCKTILNNSDPISFFSQNRRAFEYASQIKHFYSLFPDAGFGQMFSDWARSPFMHRVKSYENGASMRVIPIGYAYETEERVLLQAKASCLYTHNNREAIRGAQAVALAVYWAYGGMDKSYIKRKIEKMFSYDLSFKLNDIRENYVFDSRTGYSVPPAIVAFLESVDYESAVRLAVSLGGDADTMACIAGGIAEAYYKKIPQNIRDFCDRRIDSGLRNIIRKFEDEYPV
ncbi:MAG: ADP-ribosylglycohydrolase family protein [Clostridia bacterium]|nr:ADP-ribosylglycohydrolase family protein [Clostridia bacterium]